MMEPNAENVAREAARTLSEELAEPDLLAEANLVLRRGPVADVKLDGATTISLAALMVAVAKLAVAIRAGRTGKGAKTHVELADELHRRLLIQTDASPEAVERIVRHVANAIFKDSQ